ncbi:MAG: RidA family protein [Aggregatilineales bacterium]
MSKHYLNPPNLFQSQQYGFSQIVKVKGGTTVYFSGQVGWDENQALTGSGDLAAQTRGAFGNLQKAVQAAGGQMPDIVALRIYVVNYQREAAAPISQCLREFFPPDALPVTTWIGVQSLARPELLIEIEAVAVLED